MAPPLWKNGRVRLVDARHEIKFHIVGIPGIITAMGNDIKIQKAHFISSFLLVGWDNSMKKYIG